MLVSPYGTLSKWLHWLFEASLVIKGLLAFCETLGGIGLLLTPNVTILNFVGWLFGHNLTQTPNEDMAQWVRHLVETFPIEIQHFYALYLLGHGALKFAMVIMLARRILWAYPAAMAILAGFVIYQTTEFVTQGSVILLLLSFFDAFMIALVYREWGMLKFTRTA
jgi:uncharacterized membrane protein